MVKKNKTWKDLVRERRQEEAIIEQPVKEEGASGICKCGEGKLFTLGYLDHQMTRTCRVCGETIIV